MIIFIMLWEDSSAYAAPYSLQGGREETRRLVQVSAEEGLSWGGFVGIFFILSDFLPRTPLRAVP